MKIDFNCRQCGSKILFPEFQDKVAERCDICGVIWEAKSDGTVELELLQLVGGRFHEKGVIHEVGDGLTGSVFPEILRKNEEALKAWNEPKEPDCPCCEE